MIKSYAAAAYLVCTDYNIKLSDDTTPLFDQILFDVGNGKEITDYFNQQLAVESN